MSQKGIGADSSEYGGDCKDSLGLDTNKTFQ